MPTGTAAIITHSERASNLYATNENDWLALVGLTESADDELAEESDTDYILSQDSQPSPAALNHTDTTEFVLYTQQEDSSRIIHGTGEDQQMQASVYEQRQSSEYADANPLSTAATCSSAGSVISTPTSTILDYHGQIGSNAGIADTRNNTRDEDTGSIAGTKGSDGRNVEAYYHSPSDEEVETRSTRLLEWLTHEKPQSGPSRNQ